MAAKGFTTEVCPGCGERNYRKKDSVCPECHSLLETGRMYFNEYEKLSSDENFIEVKIPTHWSSPRVSPVKLQSLTSFNSVGNILTRLIHLVSFKKGKTPTYGYMRYLENHLTFQYINRAVSQTHVAFQDDRAYNRHYDNEADAIINKQVLSILEELHQAINLALNEAETNALEHGKKSLFLLNSGQLSLSDFEKE